VVLIASLSMMSFRSQSNFENEMVDLKNYEINHKEMYTYAIALQNPEAEAAKAGGWAKIAKMVWRNTCTNLAFEVATWWFGSNSLTIEQVQELEANNVLRKL
jgi:hypothetical protein